MASLPRNLFAQRGATLVARGGKQAIVCAVVRLTCEGRRCGTGDRLQNNQTGENGRDDRAGESSQCLEWRHLQLVQRNRIAVKALFEITSERCHSATGRMLMHLHVCLQPHGSVPIGASKIPLATCRRVQDRLSRFRHLRNAGR